MHAAERHGFASDSNCISLTFATGAANIKRRGARKETKEDDAVQGLYRIAAFMGTPHMHYTYGCDNGTAGIVLTSQSRSGVLGPNKKSVHLCGSIR